jgi:TatD DNase family protein
MSSSKKRRDIPRFGHPIIETHCHLDYLEPGELDSTLEQSSAVGVERIITIAVSPGNLQRVRELAAGDRRIWGTQGIHPHEAESFSAEVADAVREGAALPRMLAVGEIGLDYYYDHADRAVQRRVFEAQLQIAVEMELPIVVHTREADGDTRDILADYAGALTRKGVIHSFTSGLPLAEFCLAEGFVLGFNGIATFNSADNVREVVDATPMDQLLLETDAPYLTPVPYRGKVNAPYYLPFIAERIAQIKQVDIEHLLSTTYRNSLALFFPEETGVQAS